MTATTKNAQHKPVNRRKRKPLAKRHGKDAGLLSARSIALGGTLVKVVDHRARKLGPKKAKPRQPNKNDPGALLAARVLAIAVRKRRIDAAKGWS